MRIYLDHNATSPLRPEARRALIHALRAERGNPSSSHALGREARYVLEEARADLAQVLGVRPSEVVFTSGGTESNAIAILGLALASNRRVVCSTPIEHSSVLRPLELLSRQGWEVRFLEVDARGRVVIEHLRALMAAGNVALVSVGWANAETGVCQPMAEISALCRASGVPLHSDAVQALGRIPVDPNLVDVLSASAHKFGGPWGCGFLFVRSGIELYPVLSGGGQERGLRGGTENVPGILGCVAALRRALEELPGAMAHCAILRERLWAGFGDLPGVVRYSLSGADFLPNTLCVGFAGIAGDALVARLDLEGVCASVGSACAAGAAEPSHVLRALGVSDEAARNAVRFSLGAENTLAEIEEAASIIRRLVLETWQRRGSEQWVAR
jgi:cysteine desulfurase